MSASIPFDVGLSLPPHNGHAVVDRIVRARCGSTISSTERRDLFTPDCFGLPGVRAYHALGEQQRQVVRERLAFVVLAEAYFVEQMGIAYAAKMILLARSVSERKLYSFFAAEEARHLSGVEALLERHDDPPQPTSFHELVGGALSQGERLELVATIQVILEGFGLDHYRQLAVGCVDRSAARFFRSLVKDEAAHFGAGQATVRAEPLAPTELEFVFEVVAELARALASGPTSTMAVLEAAHGGLTLRQRRELIDEIHAFEHAQVRLDRVARRLSDAGLATIRERAERLGLLAPTVGRVQS
jgi:rubrerythrin